MSVQGASTDIAGPAGQPDSSGQDTAATAANDEPAATETAPSSPTPAPATTAAAPAKPAIPNPEAKPSTQVSKPVAGKPAVRTPAETKAATTVASKSTPWRIDRKSTRLNSRH